MKLGFTGTRQGMSPAQKATFFGIVKIWDVQEFIHGLCIGADADAHEIVRLVSSNIHIIGRPGRPSGHPHRAEKLVDSLYEPDTPIKRNRLIVDQSDQMIACPAGETLRSGTWATIRYAYSVGRRTLIIFPNGGTHEPL